MPKFKSKTNEQYVQELIDKKIKFRSLEEYKGANEKINHQCLECGYIYFMSPHVILRSAVCPRCSTHIDTEEKYIEKLKEIRPDLKLNDKFVDRKTKVKHIHIPCGNEIMIDPNHALNPDSKGGCKYCAAKRRMYTNEWFMDKIKENNPNIKIMSKYQGCYNHVTFECPNGHITSSIATNLIRGHGCKICANIKTSERCKFTQEEFVNRVKQNFPNIEILSNYNGLYAPITYKCNECGIVRTIERAINVYSYGCSCNRYNGEQTIAQYLNDNNIPFISQKRFDGLTGYSNRKLSYDFYLPTYNKLIEFQGAQHERPVEYFGGQEQFEIQQEYDKRKRNYAKEHNIDLLEIWYYDYDNIEQILNDNLKIECVETAG